MSHNVPSGAKRRSHRYSKVRSSGAIRPLTAENSVAMLHRVRRASISSARTAEPANSITLPLPPAAPWRLINSRQRSLAPTAVDSAPSKLTRRVCGFLSLSVPVARACYASVEPIPQASAPMPPCVQVWLSGQTMVSPGNASASSGEMTCTMP